MKGKYKIKTFSFTLICFIFISINSQNDYLRFTDYDDTVNVHRFSSVSKDYLPDEVIETPFENEIFQEGTLFKNNQPVISKLFFRYQ